MMPLALLAGSGVAPAARILCAGFLIRNACPRTMLAGAASAQLLGPTIPPLTQPQHHFSITTSRPTSTTSHSSSTTPPAAAAPQHLGSSPPVMNPANTTGSSRSSAQQPAAAAGRSSSDLYRWGYGAKVSVPPLRRLQRPLLSGAADVKARAYHIGWHIHIGMLAAAASRLRLRKLAGKDHVIIWLRSNMNAPSSSSSSSSAGPNWRPFLARGAELARGADRYFPREPGQRLPQGLKDTTTDSSPAATTSSSGSNSSSAPSVGPTTASSSSTSGATQQQQQQLSLLVAFRYGSLVFLRCPEVPQQRDIEALQLLLRPRMLYTDRPQDAREFRDHPQRQHHQQHQEERQWQPAAPAGSSNQQQAQLRLFYERTSSSSSQQAQLSRLLQALTQVGQEVMALPRQLRGNLLTHGPQAPTPDPAAAAAGEGDGGGEPHPGDAGHSSAGPAIEPFRLSSNSNRGGVVLAPRLEEYTLLVDPDAPAAVAAAPDALKLRVLDMGSMRVISSLLAQSVALDWYHKSVGASLESFQRWKAQGQGRATTGTTSISSSSSSANPYASGSSGSNRWQLRDLWEKGHDRILQQVLARAALVSSQARRTLEQVEPAWQYDAYHDTWALMAREFELEPRLKSLMTKLGRLEKEARFDVKRRHGRRYHTLSKAVEVLLMMSVAMAVYELGQAAVTWLRQHQQQLEKELAAAVEAEGRLQEGWTEEVQAAEDATAGADGP